VTKTGSVSIASAQVSAQKAGANLGHLAHAELDAAQEALDSLYARWGPSWKRKTDKIPHSKPMSVAGVVALFQQLSTESQRVRESEHPADRAILEPCQKSDSPLPYCFPDRQ
jgi:hypothetical protein